MRGDLLPLKSTKRTEKIMNENTLKLIEQLAQKLGTTSEYLWGVLIQQSYIQATIGIVEVALVIVAFYVYLKIHYKLSSKTYKDRYGDTISGYDKYEEGAVIPMSLSGVLLLVFIIWGFLNISHIITGFLNPEYWALEQILNTLK